MLYLCTYLCNGYILNLEDLGSMHVISKFTFQTFLFEKKIEYVLCEWYLQQGTNIPEWLLNKPYANEVTLTGQDHP